MQEALKAIIVFAHTEMETEKIYAHISVDNQASIKLTKKLGFKNTGKQYFDEFYGTKYLLL